MRSIGCDLGSNTLRIVELDSEDKNYIKTYEEVVKTADGLKKSGVIADEAIRRVLGAFESAKSEFDFTKNTKCVATEALRVAKNGDELMQKIRELMSIDAQIISSKQEAYFSSLGVEYELNRLKIGMDEYILVDFGGASTEVSCKKDGILNSTSYPFGVRILHDMCQNEREIKKYLLKFLHQISLQVEPFLHLPLILIAGTPTLVSAYKMGLNYQTYDSSKVSGSRLLLDDFAKALSEFKNMDEKKRAFFVGDGRKDVAVDGIVALMQIMSVCHKSEALVIDAGLAEGVALSLC